MESAASIDRPLFAWTDENIACAKNGMEGGLSASQIGRQIGCTRNAVIGKMLRMGIKSANGKGHQLGVPAPWKSIPKAPPKPRPNKQTVVARVAWKRAPIIPIEEPVQPSSEPPPNAKSFDELLAGECRWPYGVASPYLFCADAQEKDRPYCAVHCAIAYRATPRQERPKFEVAA